METVIKITGYCHWDSHVGCLITFNTIKEFLLFVLSYCLELAIISTDVKMVKHEDV